METILEIIKPIKLLSGSHSDTGQTGQGCFMNVIAYLNGEKQITDRSPCVCGIARPLIIQRNDFLNDSERQEMLPYIERAMGSATDDKVEIKRRLDLLIVHGRQMEKWWRDHADAIAIDNAIAYATAIDNANAYAKAIDNANANTFANAEFRAYFKKSCFEFFDAVLPKPTDVKREVLDRAHKLAEFA
jgi:hypothetical protein